MLAGHCVTTLASNFQWPTTTALQHIPANSDTTHCVHVNVVATVHVHICTCTISLSCGVHSGSPMLSCLCSECKPGLPESLAGQLRGQHGCLCGISVTSAAGSPCSHRWPLLYLLSSWHNQGRNGYIRVTPEGPEDGESHWTVVHVLQDSVHHVLSCCLQTFLHSRLEEWTLSRCRHMHEVNYRRCRRQPVYGRDLVKTVQSFCYNQPPSSSSSSSSHWLWAGHSTCLSQQTMPAWQRPLMGTEVLATLLPSYEERLLAGADVLNR